MKKIVFISIFILLVNSLLLSSDNLINALDVRNILDTAYSEERNFMLRQNVINNNTEAQIVPDRPDRPISSTVRLEMLRQQAIRRLGNSTPLIELSQEPVVRRRLPEVSIGTLALSSRYY